jgi:hypothetical protein
VKSHSPQDARQRLESETATQVKVIGGHQKGKITTSVVFCGGQAVGSCHMILSRLLDKRTPQRGFAIETRVSSGVVYSQCGPVLEVVGSCSGEGIHRMPSAGHQHEIEARPQSVVITQSDLEAARV